MKDDNARKLQANAGIVIREITLMLSEMALRLDNQYVTDVVHKVNNKHTLVASAIEELGNRIPREDS